ncbi:hypothetical protein KY289_008473 [Solanum tuberosum]|nr:hypothetical protein KY289_008473 [Solanum tuberosum]
MVVAGNGNMMKVDNDCKISWLLQGAEFSAEFLLLPLGSCGVQTHYECTKDGNIYLRGAVIPTMCTELLALETKDNTDKDPRVVSLLEEFCGLFAEPTGLPPSRGDF